MKASSPVVTSPGAISGSSTFQNTWSGVAPSTYAASSRSPGSARMKLVSTQIVNGSVKIR